MNVGEYFAEEENVMLRAIIEYGLQVLLLENAVAGSDGYRARLQLSEAHYCPSVIKALAARYNNIQLRHLSCHDLAMRGSGVRGLLRVFGRMRHIISITSVKVR